jgi:hypothetical protein
MSLQQQINSTIEEVLEVVFSVWSMPRLYSLGQQEKFVGQRSESVVSSQSSVALLAAAA